MKKLRKTAVIAVCFMLVFAFCTTVFAANYKVVPNDTLYKISQLFNTTVGTIKTDNKLSSDVIYPGQVLNVPAQTYTIKSGDSLYLIAQKYGVSITSIRQANNKWDSLLMPGQTLLIPAKPASGSGTSTVIPYTTAEVDLLARLIQAEAGSESYNAMVAVGGVVVNRVQSSDWPNTISAVINQKIGGYYQFAPVQNGYIKNPASTNAVNAAWAALKGSDPSNGAIFYYDDSSTNQWIRSKTVTARIDTLTFVK